MTTKTHSAQTASLTALLQVATDLTAALSTHERHHRLVEAVQKVFPCDAAALLKLEGNELVPVATAGLKSEVMTRRFDPAREPRLDAILRSRYPVRFPADERRPDPFDGLLLGAEHGTTSVHACMGCSLRVGTELVGVLTVDALELGAFDKVDDTQLALFAALAAAALRTAGLIDSLSQLAEKRGLVAETIAEETLRSQGGEILGETPAIRDLRHEIGTVAPSDLPVLILGPTGTGKELVARRLHALSARSRQPLVQVNCAALPESIAESELFGHEKGAFTGAVAFRAGKFELADGGTLFLDEVGELPLSIQPKLLRVLQAGEIQRVGQDRVHKVNVRILAATNRNLAEEVRAGRFRADLYHRLSVYPILVPALCDRRPDIPLLAQHFLERSQLKLGIRTAGWSATAISALETYDWPGNVRELEHVVMRALLRASADRGPRASAQTLVVQPAHLGLPEIPLHTLSRTQPEDTARTDAAHTAAAPSQDSEPPFHVPLGLPLGSAVDEFKRRYITATHRETRGRWTDTALRLGLDRGNLFRTRTRLGLAPKTDDAD